MNYIGEIDLTRLGQIAREHPNAIREVQFKDGVHKFLKVSVGSKKEADKWGNVAYLKAAIKKAEDILSQIKEMLSENHDEAELALTPDYLYHLKAKGKRAIMLGVENGYAIGRDIAQLQRLREAGVVYMTLCHNGNNDANCHHNYR